MFKIYIYFLDTGIFATTSSVTNIKTIFMVEN
jgi:hypothetical protein